MKKTNQTNIECVAATADARRTPHSQFAVRNSQFAIRNSQFAIRNSSEPSATATAQPRSYFPPFSLRLLFVMILSIALMSISFAGDAHHRLAKPTELGPYKIGHTTMLLTDPTRNPNGSAGTAGRPLFLHIWYPSDGGSGPLTQYSGNNPIYDGTHPPYPQVIFTVKTPSSNGSLDGLPTAHGKFPLVIYSHGSSQDAGLMDVELRETLASHGHIVVAVEHSGNNSSSEVANGLNLPNPGIFDGGNTSGYIIRSQDVSFVISQMLDRKADPKIWRHINPHEIGLFGFSAGGGTTTLTIAGLESSHFTPDTRVKAALTWDGTDFVGFTPNDYANIKIPLMLYEDDKFGVQGNPYVFPQLVNSQPKYLADVAGTLHLPSNYPSYCNNYHRDLVQVDAVPGDLVTFADTQRLFHDQYIAPECDASIFDGISDQTLVNLGIAVEVAAMKPFMPLRKEVSLEETYRLSKWYVVSFFNKTLKHEDAYARYLSNSKQNQKKNPLIDFAKNCKALPEHPFNLKNGDKITFTPTADNKKYEVTHASGNSLLDKGNNDLKLGDDEIRMISLPFSFSLPNEGMNNTICVYSNGAITATGIDKACVTSLALEPYFAPGSPWDLAGGLLLNGLPTISPLWNDLAPNLASPGHGAFATIESNRVIITWDQVPMCCSVLDVTNTFQVIINQNGTIEMIYGDMGGTGPDYLPTWLGMVGIASGKSRARDVRKIDPVDFTSLKQPITLPFTGIYEQFYLGNGVSKCGDADHNDHDDSHDNDD